MDNSKASERDAGEAPGFPQTDCDDRLAALVIAFDERLATGDTETSALETNLPDVLVTELAKLQECVALLHMAQARKGEQPTIGAAQMVLAGEWIGRFELVRELGRGGYGVVFLARDPRLERLVALKVPRPEALVTPDLRRRFLREAQAAGRLSHAHLVQIHEVGEDGALCYLVSEYCQGPSLAEWLQRSGRPATFREAALLTAELSDALAHAHAEGVLHRDIKPANVLLEPITKATNGDKVRVVDALSHYCAKLGDFGLAKLLATADGETRSGALLGTPAYMSPEQAAGHVEQITAASDVYALGAILYELLTGHAPLVGQNDTETLHVIAQHDPIPPGRLRIGLSRDLEAICLKCLEKSPRVRYASAGDLAADLRRFLAGEPTHARPLGPRQRLVKWTRRRPTLAALITVTVLAVALLIGGAVLHSVRLDHAYAESEQRRLEAETAHAGAEASRIEAVAERDANEQYRYAGEMRRAFATLAQGDVEEVERLLAEYDDGTRPTNLRGFEWHYLKRSIHGERGSLSGHDGHVYSVAFSPSGRLLASGGQDGTIRLWDPTSGQTLRTITAHQSCTNDLAFSPDGRLLASSSCDGTVKLWNTHTWQPVSTLLGHADDVLCLGFSPDRERLATGDTSGVVRIWFVDTGELQHEFRTDSERYTVDSVDWSPDGKRLLTTSSTCQLWDTATWSLVQSFPSKAVSACFSPDQHWIAREVDPERIGIADLATGNDRWYVPIYSRVQKVAYDRLGKQMIICDGEGIVRIVVPPSSDRLQESPINLAPDGVRKLIGHHGRVQDFAMSPDGETLATAGFDGTVRLWNLQAKGGTIPHLQHRVSPHGDLCLSSDLKRLTALSDDRRLVTWDVNTSQELSSAPAKWKDRNYHLFGGGEFAFAYAGSADAVYFGQAPSSGAWNLQPPYADAMTRFEVSADSSTVAAVGMDRFLRVWRQKDGSLCFERKIYASCEPTMLAPTLQLASFALSKTGRLLATNIDDLHTVFDLDSGATWSLPFPHWVGNLSFSPRDGVIAGFFGHAVYLFDNATGKVRVLRTEFENSKLAISPDETTMAIGSRDGQITLWHISTGLELATLAHLGHGFAGLQFSDDGRSLAAILLSAPQGDEPRTASLLIWDANATPEVK